MRIQDAQLTPYNGKTDPKAFIMSFEAAIQLVGGDDATMAKSFVMAVTDIARKWYTTIDPGKITSWGQLKAMMVENFQGNYDDPITSEHLFAVKQQPDETLRSFIKRFIHVKCQDSEVSERTIINAAQQGLLHGPLREKLMRLPRSTFSELVQKMEEYARAEDDRIRASGEEVKRSLMERSGQHNQKAEPRNRDPQPERPRDRAEPSRKRDPPRRSPREVQHVDSHRKEDARDNRRRPRQEETEGPGSRGAKSRPLLEGRLTRGPNVSSMNTVVGTTLGNAPLSTASRQTQGRGTEQAEDQCCTPPPRPLRNGWEPGRSRLRSCRMHTRGTHHPLFHPPPPQAQAASQPAQPPPPVAVPKQEPPAREVEHVVGNHRVVLSITRGSAPTPDSKRQRRAYVREIQHVTEGGGLPCHGVPTRQCHRHLCQHQWR